MSIKRNQIVKKKDYNEVIEEIQDKILGDLSYISFLLATQLFHVKGKFLVRLENDLSKLVKRIEKNIKRYKRKGA